MLTVCGLFYGDHGFYAHRCLGSLEANLSSGRPFVQEIRLGLNEVSRGVSDYIMGWAEEAAIRFALPILVYRSEVNVCKYPLMRKLFHASAQPVRTPLVMWFDDDAYLEPRFAWRQMLEFAADKDMIGHVYYWFIQGQQYEWVKRQPWYNPALREPLTYRGKEVFQFAQGSWWVARMAMLRKYDWPIPELRHCGGDSMLGELIRQQGLKLGHFRHGVHVNADEDGRDSKAKRRGHSEPPLGANLAASLNMDTSFHNFHLTIRACSQHGWSDMVLEA